MTTDMVYYNTDNPNMDVCGDHEFCCRTTDDSNCCSVGPTFQLKPVVSDQPSTSPATSIIDHLSTVSIVSVHTIHNTPSINSLFVTVTATHIKAMSTLSRFISGPSRKTSSTASPTLALSPTQYPEIRTRLNTVQTIDNQTTSDIHTPLSQRSILSTDNPATPSMSILQPTSSPTPDPSSSQTSEAEPPAEHHPPKTSVGLGIGLCLILGLFFVGAMVWFIRRQRRKPQKKKYHISYPISIKSIPMFEVANTDWEMPVDREMPTEMSANRRTEQNWI